MFVKLKLYFSIPNPFLLQSSLFLLMALTCAWDPPTPCINSRELPRPHPPLYSYLLNHLPTCFLAPHPTPPNLCSCKRISEHQDPQSKPLGLPSQGLHGLTPNPLPPLPLLPMEHLPLQLTWITYCSSDNPHVSPQQSLFTPFPLFGRTFLANVYISKPSRYCWNLIFSIIFIIKSQTFNKYSP